MSDPVRTDDGASLEADATTAVGVVLAGLAMAGMLVPFRQGVEEPIVPLAVGLGVVTVAVFLGRRYGFVDRAIGAPIAAISSLALVLVSGYALNQGVTGAVVAPGLEWQFPLVVPAFLAAGGATGMAVADYAGISGFGLKRRSMIATGLTVVGVLGLLATYPSAILVSIPALLILGELTDLGWIALTQLSMAIGMGGVAVGYLWLRGDDLSFIDLSVPNRWDVAWAVAGLLALFGTLIVISLVLSSTGVESADHGTAQQAAENPDILLVLIPASILIIGPFEELLYRNVVQKSLYGVFSRAGAIVVASVIFAGVHFLAYGTGDVGAVLASLGVVFGLSLVLGTIYERTDNLLVPSLVHGVYNALLFTNLYFAYA